VDTVAADKSDRVKCADTTGSELGKLVAAVIKCHIKLADSDFGGKDFDENLCEENDPVKGKSALQKFNAAMVKLTASGKCAQSCLSEPNRIALGTSILAQAEAANQIVYPCPATTTTTTTSTTTTTCPGGCCCAGGAPSTFSFTTGLGSGTCGHLDAAGSRTLSRPPRAGPPSAGPMPGLPGARRRPASGP